MKVSHVVGIVFLVLVLILGMSWVVQGNDFFLYKVFAPKREQVRHDVFKESQAYNDGKVTHLTKLKLDYTTAESEAHRCTLRSMALREAATANEDRLPNDLVVWIGQLERDTSCN